MTKHKKNNSLYNQIINNEINTIKHSAKWCEINKPMKQDVMLKTPISLAASMGNLEMVKVLHKRNAIFTIADKNGDFTIHNAVMGNYFDIVSYILQKYPNESRRKNLRTGKTAAHYAASMGKLDLVKILVPKMTSVDTIDDNGETILSNASLSYSSDVVQYLISNGADVNSKDATGKTPLHNACTTGNFNSVSMLCSMGSDVNSVDEYGCTPLHYAASINNLNIVKYLIERGAIIYTRDNSNRLPYDCASSSEVKEILKIRTSVPVTNDVIDVNSDSEDDVESPTVKVENVEDASSSTTEVPSSGELLEEPEPAKKGWFSWLW